MTKLRRVLKSFRFISESKFILYYSLVERIFFFLFFLIIARKFQVDSYGELITGFAIANASAIMFDLGVPIHLQKEISSGKNTDKLMPSVLSLNLILLPLFLLAALSIGVFAYNIPMSLMLMICTPVYLFSGSNLISKALAGFGDFRSQFYSVVKTRIPLLVFLAAFYFTGQSSPFPYLIALTAGALAQLTMLLVKLRTRIKVLPGFVKGVSMIRNLFIVLPLGAAVALNFLYDKIDILLISKMLGFTESAIYSIAYGLFKAAALSYTFFLIPALSKISYFSRRKSAVRLYLAKYTLIIFLICVFVIVALVLSADIFVELLYGEKFNESANILKVLSFATLGMGLNNLFGVALNGLGLYKENLYVTFSGLIINIILNVLLIPTMGIMGAVIATLATEYLVLAGDSYYIKDFLRKA
ncbi:MAG: polysaccharide biosynthesis C-terminal domain-containing protein [Ignavibacteria bacterium]|nr:polysaccharide biosynthesis C-terminal domain-containing protein [Ignavibacteria bacterium]